MSETPYTQPDSAEGNSIYVDDLCRLIIGSLHSSPHMYPQAAEKFLEQIRNMRVIANTRKGKDEQWFATLETIHSEILVLSDKFNDQKQAQKAALDAAALLGK